MSHHIYLTDRMRHGPWLRMLCLLSSLNPWGLLYSALEGVPPRTVSCGSQGLCLGFFSVSGILPIFLKTLTLDEIDASFSQPQCECGVVSDIRMSVERRQHKRFQVPPRIFVGVGPHFTKVGRLRNLSTDGFSFRYVGSKKPSSGSYVDIFTLEGDLFFTSLPINIVSDIEVGEKAPPSAITTRRCSVKFGELTPPLKAELERFIKDHAIGEE